MKCATENERRIRPAPVAVLKERRCCTTDWRRLCRLAGIAPRLDYRRIVGQSGRRKEPPRQAAMDCGRSFARTAKPASIHFQQFVRETCRRKLSQRFVDIVKGSFQ